VTVNYSVTHTQTKPQSDLSTMITMCKVAGAAEIALNGPSNLNDYNDKQYNTALLIIMKIPYITYSVVAQCSG